MIKANVAPLKHYLGKMNNECGSLIHYLDRFKAADGLVTLTDEQKTEVMEIIQANASNIQDIYTTLVSVFTAPEAVVVPEAPIAI